MSVLRSVKDKFHNVQEDLKASFKSLSLSSNSDENLKKLSTNTDIPSLVNADAGAELLDRFQSYWAQIHENSEDNAKRASQVDREISDLLLYFEQQSLKFQQLSTELSHVQFLSRDIQNLHGSLATLEMSFSKLESDLDELDDLCEEVEFQRNCKTHQKQLQTWEEGRVREMQELKVRMSQEHVKQVQAHEQEKQEKIRLRQEALQEAFMSDMDEYRKHGKIDRGPSSCSESHVDIADIEINENDDDELNEFFDAENIEVVKDELPDLDLESTNIQIIEDEDVTPESEEAMKHEIGGDELVAASVESGTEESDSKG